MPVRTGGSQSNFFLLYFRGIMFCMRTVVLFTAFYALPSLGSLFWVGLFHRPWASLYPLPPAPPPPPRGRWGGFHHMVISGYLDHQSTQFRLCASELLLFVSVVLVLINAL